MQNYQQLQKTQTLFCTAVFCEILYKISRQTGKPFLSWHSGNMTTYDFYLFSFQFTIKILLTLPLIQLEARALFIGVIFFLLLPLLLKLSNTEGKIHAILQIFVNRNIYRKTTVLQSLFKRCYKPTSLNFFKKRLQHRYYPVNIAKL